MASAPLSLAFSSRPFLADALELDLLLSSPALVATTATTRPPTEQLSPASTDIKARRSDSVEITITLEQVVTLLEVFLLFFFFTPPPHRRPYRLPGWLSLSSRTSPLLSSPLLSSSLAGWLTPLCPGYGPIAGSSSPLPPLEHLVFTLTTTDSTFLVSLLLFACLPFY